MRNPKRQIRAEFTIGRRRFCVGGSWWVPEKGRLSLFLFSFSFRRPGIVPLCIATLAIHICLNLSRVTASIFARAQWRAFPSQRGLLVYEDEHVGLLLRSICFKDFSFIFLAYESFAC